MTPAWEIRLKQLMTSENDCYLTYGNMLLATMKTEFMLMEHPQRS